VAGGHQVLAAQFAQFRHAGGGAHDHRGTDRLAGRERRHRVQRHEAGDAFGVLQFAVIPGVGNHEIHRAGVHFLPQLRVVESNQDESVSRNAAVKPAKHIVPLILGGFDTLVGQHRDADLLPGIRRERSPGEHEQADKHKKCFL
jgi:hypothetical protein